MATNPGIRTILLIAAFTLDRDDFVSATASGGLLWHSAIVSCSGGSFMSWPRLPGRHFSVVVLRDARPEFSAIFENPSESNHRAVAGSESDPVPREADAEPVERPHAVDGVSDFGGPRIHVFATRCAPIESRAGRFAWQKPASGHRRLSGRTRRFAQSPGVAGGALRG